MMKTHNPATGGNNNPQVDETFNKEWQRAMSHDPDAEGSKLEVTSQAPSDASSLQLQVPDCEVKGEVS